MAYMKDAFEKWLETLKRESGESYSKVTIGNYIEVIKNYCKKLDGLDIPSSDLFNIDSAEKFDDTLKIIKSHPDYNRINESYHRIFSSGLNMYKQFLESFTNNANEIEFTNWLRNYEEHKYRESTINRYVVAIKKAEERLEIKLDIPILAIKDIVTFENTVQVIRNSPKYEFVNKKYGNGDLSAALTAYSKFIVFINSKKTKGKFDVQEHIYGAFDSWEIIDEFTAVKHCDKSFFEHNSSGVPKGICWFFGADLLNSGESKSVDLIYNGQKYQAKISNDSTDRRRIQILWKSELGKMFASFRSDNTTATFRKTDENTYEITIKGGEKEMTTKEKIAAIKNYIAAKGFNYEGNLIENFYLSLKSKPFVILAGTSGTGKTRLVKLFAEAIDAEYKLVSVRPDWSDSSDLFGHVDLNQKFVEGSVVKFVKQAELNPSKPYFLCLDEMNLARVEYYMSDILSAIETRRNVSGVIVTDPIDVNYGNDTAAAGRYGKLILPGNLYIVGTVNMDETTFPFSKKVLDRANTIEFSYVDLLSLPSFSTETAPEVAEDNDFLVSEYITLNDCDADDKGYIGGICTTLSRVNGILEMANLHVGYRIRDEIVFYLLNNKKADLLDEKAAFDNQIMQKILPRIQGSSESIKKMLEELLKICDSENYTASVKKINFMIKRYDEDGFTSYWL